MIIKLFDQPIDQSYQMILNNEIDSVLPLPDTSLMVPPLIAVVSVVRSPPALIIVNPPYSLGNWEEEEEEQKY